MERLRISAISYLNTAPLMWDFEHGSLGANFEISYTIPSQCAVALQAGTADIGIIPAAAYAFVPDLAVLPGVAIASRRAVRSILLVSRVPLDQIRSVALDTSSITSVALTKVLFEKWWGGSRDYVLMPPDLNQMLHGHDAALVIGDPALKIDRSQYITYDLAEEWIRLTGKPFVFAFWAVRRATSQRILGSSELISVFQKSRDHGLDSENLRRIAQEWAPRLGLSPAQIVNYLSESIYYQLDAACLEGLQLFYEYSQEYDVLPPAPPLRFLEAARTAAN